MKTPHILGSASNLLGITLLIIAGLHLSDQAAKTLADEVAWGGALCFSASCWLSYLALRSGREDGRMERWADTVFMGGLTLLSIAIIVLALAGV